MCLFVSHADTLTLALTLALILALTLALILALTLALIRADSLILPLSVRSHTLTKSLSLVSVVLMKTKELKTSRSIFMLIL